MKRGPMTARQLRNRDALQGFQRVIWERSGGMCEANTPACPTFAHKGEHCHHRSISERRVGVHNPDHGLLVCRAGHDWTHANPAESYERGLLLRAST